jgi:hypothetical protein
MFVRSDAYQFLYLSREEYIALKTHLAKMRGFDVKPEEKAA